MYALCLYCTRAVPNTHRNTQHYPTQHNTLFTNDSHKEMLNKSYAGYFTYTAVPLDYTETALILDSCSAYSIELFISLHYKHLR